MHPIVQALADDGSATGLCLVSPGESAAVDEHDQRRGLLGLRLPEVEHLLGIRAIVHVCEGGAIPSFAAAARTALAFGA